MIILIIDDERCIRDSLAEQFKMEGYITISASSLKEAKTVIERESFDIALVDFWLLDGKGTEIVGLIKTIRPGSKIIGMSGTEQGSTFRIAGADSFIQKPFNDKEILNIINGWTR